MSDMVGGQYCHRKQGAYIGSEMSPVLHGLMPSRDQTTQRETVRDVGEDGGAKHVVERSSPDFQYS